MDIFTLILQILATMIGVLAVLMSIMLFVRLHWPSAMLWFAKEFASALSPLLALAGAFSLLVGLTTGSTFISMLGLYAVLVYSIHIFRVTRPPDAATGFGQAFGPEWENRILPDLKNRFLPGRTLLRLPPVPWPRFEQNIVFATLPGSDRKLLCDVWQPPEGVGRSGVAFIYLHGSAFYLLDKDFGTRPLFRHLASQGHVVMDVAYRLAPETDIMGMVHDVQHAIVWMKNNAGTYGTDPNRIVLGGGSAGGHLAMLTAYTVSNSEFRAGDLEGKDIGVHAVISLYGPTDIEATYYHTNQHLTTRSEPGRPKMAVPTQMPAWMVKSMGEDFHRLGFDKGFENAGAFAPLLGGHPDERPGAYALFSPLTHVHPGCPPTLLIHGEHDIMVPVTTTHLMYNRLTDAKVPVIMHILPQTEHAFDLFLPVISPSAHNAIYDVERFLALQVNSIENPERMTKKREELLLK